MCGLDLKADQFEVQDSRITDGVYPSSCGLLYSGKLLNWVQDNSWGKNGSFLRISFQDMPYDPKGFVPRLL